MTLHSEDIIPSGGESWKEETSSALWAACAVAVPMALPIISILVLALAAGPDSWRNAFAPTLWPLTSNTLLLCVGTSLFSLVLGLASSLLISFYYFPLRKPLTWLAFLPIAMPGYIISYLYVDFLNYAGPLQTWLRGVFGWSSPQDYVFPEVRSLPGAVLVMSLVLYPYVYLAGRAAFARQPVNQIFVARTLGHRPWVIFLKVVLPQARPAIAAGLVLVVMECLNDIGAVSFFGVRTYAIAIFSTWLDQGSLGGAAALALIMIAAAMLLVIAERWARAHDRLPRTQHPDSGYMREQLTGAKGWLATAVVCLPVFLGFFLPLILLLGHGFRRFGDASWGKFLSAAGNSAFLALASAAIAVLLALTIAYAKRRAHSPALEVVTFLANTGYAIPGAVLAIGIIVPFGIADHVFNGLTLEFFDTRPGLLLSGTVIALLFAYVARFLISATGMLEAGYERIPRSIDSAARTLGHSPIRTLFAVHVPMLKPAFIAAALLVFVDAMKELPATLLLRPFNFETLATEVFTYASLGQIEEAALPSLLIVGAGLIPVIVLMRGFRQARVRSAKTP
jgi:iron(III) transport system permease protein